MMKNKQGRISFLSEMMKYILIVASVFLLATCGNNDTSLVETGSAIFSIKWPESVRDGSRASQELNNPSIDCDGLSVATVEVDVNGSNQGLLVEASFPCSQGAGTIDQIPVGTDREFIVTAKTATGETVYEGSVSGIEIQADVISDCGAIEMIMVDADGDEVPDVLDSCPQSPALDVVGEDGCSVLRFTDMGDGTVKDNTSGLIWLKNANALGLMAWEDARSAVANLSDGENGLSDGSADGDWRLPTLGEWEAFIDTDYSDPALCDAEGNTHWTEGDAFTGVQSWFHWSSTEGDSCAWRIGLTYGGTACNGKSDELYVWPVRDVLLDSDGDSVADDQDTCPNTPAGETIDQNGCSDSQKDSDGDGVVDSQDACPNTLSGVAVDQYGCEQNDGLINSYYTSTVINIDGDASEWTDVPGFQIPSTKYITLYSELSAPDDDQDCSAFFQSVWDDTNIYFIIRVTDDVINRDSTTVSQDDSTSLYIDGSNNDSTSYDSDDSQLVVDVEDNVFINGNDPGFQHKASTSGSSYIIEYAVPIANVPGLTPYAGDSFGVDIAVNDDDNVGDDKREHSLVWHGDGTGWLDPRQFGTMTLRKKAGE